MQDSVEEIAQLATATASYRGTVAILATKCQTCHSTQGHPLSDHAAQERDRVIEEQDQTYLTGRTNHQDKKQRQLLLVAWLSGIEITYARDL
jgi:hypothetical protein